MGFGESIERNIEKDREGGKNLEQQ